MTITAAGSRAWLCGQCLPEALGARDPAVGQQAASILKALLQPREAAALTTLPPLDTRAACPRCGLSYTEFETDGRAGCAACYTAFAPAIHHALAVLHNPG